MKKEWLGLGILMILGLLVRSLNFEAHLNFSADQGKQSLEAREIWQQREIILIGPAVTSYEINGRHIFYGSAVYYIQIFFLKLGNWDPAKSSYLLTIFVVFMAIPLYFGVKRISNIKSATLTVIIYLLLPYYVDYSRFLWNPNYQLSLVPILVWLIPYPILAGIWGGIILPLHYQLIIGLAGLLFKIKNKFSYLAGILIGLTPLLLFELKNNFYNLNTVWLLLTNWGRVAADKNGVAPHYFLGSSLVIFVLILTKFKIKQIFIVMIGGILLIWDLLRFIPYPTHGFGMINGWHYRDEVRVSQIIKSQNLTNFNVVNLPYDTLASVQKYLLNLNNQDYKNNKYLFVIAGNDKYMANPAYEINTFRPSKQIKQWQINKEYELYLLERSDN